MITRTVIITKVTGIDKEGRECHYQGFESPNAARAKFKKLYPGSSNIKLEFEERKYRMELETFIENAQEVK